MILGTIWRRSGLEDEKQALILTMTPHVSIVEEGSSGCIRCEL